jgi:2-polyprenyl-3-methyl-5-hydroxy-6-metoxy-1,4-benzoquinol methylase
MIRSDVQSLIKKNYAFSVDLNKFDNFIDRINSKYNRIVIYGYGVAGRIIYARLTDKVIGIVDQNSGLTEHLSESLSVNDIGKADADCILITVLGRESAIAEQLCKVKGVNENIITLVDLCGEQGFQQQGDIRESIIDADKNLQYNRERWGSRNTWLHLDQLGYSWDSQNTHTVSSIAGFADQYLRPYTQDRYDLDILELSPGAGRFTAEVMRYARKLDLVDMNAACLELCKERFGNVSLPIEYFCNDGRSLEMLNGRQYDLIVCFDSMVHMHEDIIADYVSQFAQLIRQGGYIWLDHSGKGAKNSGHRTNMSAEKMSELAEQNKLKVVRKYFRNAHDCISVLGK